MTTPSAVRAAAVRYVEQHSLRIGTHPENLAAMRLHRAGAPFVQQHKAGRYRLDLAVPAALIAIEVDGPHHHRPDVAHRDALRDAWLRSQGWLILRVTAGAEDELATASRLIHLALQDPGWRVP